MKTLHFLLATALSIGIFSASQTFAQQGQSDQGNSYNSPQMLTPGEQPNQRQEPDYSSPGGGETQPYYGEQPYSFPETEPYYGENPSPNQGSPQLPSPLNPNGEFPSPSVPFGEPTDVPGPGTGT